MRGGSGGVCVRGKGVGGGVEVKIWTFDGGEGGRVATKIEQLRTSGERGFKSWPICDNVIIKCPL